MSARMVIVPNEVRDAINRKLDSAFVLMPEAIRERDALYHQLLSYFDQFGTVPDFEITKTERDLCQ